MSFEKRYNALNERQKEAVDAIFGPVLVIAGPGSGKTELLAVRIAHILRQTDALPNNILCLTFTDNAAKNMRTRLAKIIWSDAYKVAIHTFHTFGMEILQKYQHKLREQGELTVIDEVTKAKIFNEIAVSLPWNHPYKAARNINAVTNAIENLKKANISPDDFRNILLLNELVLEKVWPKIINTFKIFSTFGRKKTDTEKKMQMFQELFDEISLLLSNEPKMYIFQETLAKTLIDSMNDVILSGDSKKLTKWKNTFLSKTSKDDFEMKDQEKLKKSFGLLEIYQSYNERLESLSMVDFSDMILRSIEILKNDESVRSDLAEQYQWILVDEYQDTNDAQLALVNFVASTSDMWNIFVVGDDDQSIYKFQGANTKNIRLFHDLYADTKLIILEKNYRSNEEIITESRRVISRENAIGEIFEWAQKRFQSHRGEGGLVQYLCFENELEELSFVASKIQDIIKKNVNNPDFRLSDIAVISKKNDTLEMIAKFLSSLQIPFELSKESHIFSDPVVSIVVKILEYVSSLSSPDHKDSLLVEILSHEAFKIHRLTLWEVSQQIFRAKKDEKKIWIEILKNHPDKQIARIAFFLIELSIRSKNERLESIIDLIIGSNSIRIPDEYEEEVQDRDQILLPINNENEPFVSPIFSYYFSDEILEKNPLSYQISLNNIRKFIDSIRTQKKQNPHITLKDFAEYMSLLDDYSINISTSTLIAKSDAVQCITAHKSKWLEYSYVFAIGMTEANYARKKNDSNPFMSNFSLLPEKDETEDIERLVYTVFTRAKNELFVSYSLKNLEEKSQGVVSVLSHIKDEEWDKNQWICIDNCSKILEQRSVLITDIPFSDDEKNFLKHTISRDLKISATAIQNFLNVADGGPDYYLLKNIIRFPQAKMENAIYGTAMHKALEDFFKDYSHKKTFQKNILFESFEASLQAEGLPEERYATFLARWKEKLEQLYPHIIWEYGQLYLELWFNILGGGVFLKDIRLSGKIDRIEFLDGETILVTDYKTGGAVTNLDFKSGTAYERIKKWKYKLQLVFYAILFEESEYWKKYRHQFELFFVESDNFWNFHHIKDFPQRGEIERLKSLIVIISEHIKNLNFPDVSNYPKTIDGILQFEEDLLSGKI